MRSVIGADPNRDFEAAEVIRRHLDPGESLIWVGSITFGSPHPFLGRFANTGWVIGGGMPVMFFRVPHAKRVFDSIIAAQGG